MDQMNVSITDRLAGYVRKKVKSGRYNNASEVVRDALRRMEDEDARGVRLASPTAEDIVSDLTGEQVEGIRQRVRAGIESIDAGEYREYEGREGLKKLADGAKARGRKLLAAGSLPPIMRYRVSRNAEQDLDEIFLYWAKRAGLKVADRLMDSITDRFWLLGEHPDAGRSSEDIAAGVRCFPAGKYLIYYRQTRRVTDILHIFHGAQDQKMAFRTAAMRWKQRQKHRSKL